MDDYNPDTSLNEEETQFIKMRESIASLIFEFWLKLKDLEPILSEIMDIGKNIIEESSQVLTDEINYQLEALLDVFYHYLEGVRDKSKISKYEGMIEKINDFFLNDNMKSIFVGQNCHWLLSKRYLDWVVQLKQFIKDDDSRK